MLLDQRRAFDPVARLKRRTIERWRIDETSRAGAGRGSRPVYFASAGFVDTPTFDRAALKAGNRIEGPALIEEHASTTVVHPGDMLEVDAFGGLIIEVRRS